MHQNLLFYSEESERASFARFSDTPAAQLYAACFELRSSPEQDLSNDVAPKHSNESDFVGVHTIYEIGFALRKALRDIPVNKLNYLDSLIRLDFDFKFHC